jgi:hypothetical protein
MVLHIITKTHLFVDFKNDIYGYLKHTVQPFKLNKKCHSSFLILFFHVQKPHACAFEERRLIITKNYVHLAFMNEQLMKNQKAFLIYEGMFLWLLT